jgi:hypothetical protein
MFQHALNPTTQKLTAGVDSYRTPGNCTWLSAFASAMAERRWN